MKLSQYIVDLDNLPKALCTLVEKCYYQKSKLLICVANEIFSKEYDKLLWTYTRKHFIPHAIDTDPHQEEHPIIISYNPDNIQNPMNCGVTTQLASEVEFREKSTKFDIILLVNVTNEIKNLYLKKMIDIKNDLKRIITLEDSDIGLKNEYHKEVQKFLAITEYEQFIQNKSGIWQKVL